MTPILKKFLKVKEDDVRKIVREYILMRKMFIDNGVKDHQLEWGEGMTHRMYTQREEIIYMLKKLKSDARKFGLIQDDGFEFDDYFSNLFIRVDKKTPL